MCKIAIKNRERTYQARHTYILQNLTASLPNKYASVYKNKTKGFMVDQIQMVHRTDLSNKTAKETMIDEFAPHVVPF